MILEFILFSTSSMDGPSVGLFVHEVTSSLIQLNNLPSDSIPVKVNSSINPFLVTYCSIIICPAPVLGRWHFV